MGTPIGRTVAACLGAFALLNLPGRENLWWIDVRPLPQALLALPAACLLLHAIVPTLLPRTTRACVVLLFAVLCWNSVRFYQLPIDAGVPVPFTALVAGLTLLVLKAPRTRWPKSAALLTACLLVAGFPVAQAFFFGKTSYARRADVIVVFGARCYADGRPSQSLEDRVRTACRLYHEDLAPRLLFSGGPGDGATHETEAMRRLALDLGVPGHAIALDPKGLDTWATVRHTGPGRILAVSHFYHLPRIQLMYRRAGRTAFTVPAEEAYTVSQTPRLVAREIAAFWFYWAKSLPGARRISSAPAMCVS